MVFFDFDIVVILWLCRFFFVFYSYIFKFLHLFSIIVRFLK